MNRDHWTVTLVKGIVGGSGTGLMAVASSMPIDTALSRAAAILGVLVALGTLVSICFDIRRKWRARNQ